MKVRVINYQKAIESGFDIIGKDGQRQPFRLNPVQVKYLGMLKADYPTMQGIRENDLKARQEGFSALIDAILTVDFLTGQNIGGQIISHKKEETEILMNRVNFYVDSWCEKHGVSRKDLLKTDSKDFLEHRTNGSYLFIGTAGAKTLGRGGTLQNIHWSEVGFYPNTEIINAERLVTAAEQQVMMGIGKIFRESTGNMKGDYFSREIDRSKRGDSNFKFRFFPWFENPEYQLVLPSAFTPTAEEQAMMQRHNLTAEQMFWYRRKASEFETRALFLREYPTTPDESFLASGTAFFDPDVMLYYKERITTPLKSGEIAFDGSFI